MLNSKPSNYNDQDLKFLKKQNVITVIRHLQPSILKQVDEYNKCTLLFEAFEQRFYRKILSNMMYASLKLMIFKMKYSSTKIKDHFYAFDDLVIDVHNLGDEIFYERNKIHLLSSLATSY